MASSSSGSSKSNITSLPRDAKIMAAILREQGISEYEPRVLNLMLELMYRYVTEVLEDAKLVASHADRKDLEMADVKLAVEMKVEESFTNPPPRDFYVDIANEINGQPTPLIKSLSGPKVPPDRHCLVAPNFKLKDTPKATTQAQHAALPIGGYGHPPHSIKTGVTKVVVTKGVSHPTVSLVSRQAPTSLASVQRAGGGQGVAGGGAITTVSQSSLKRKREDGQAD